MWCALYFVSQILITGLADIVKIPLAGTVVRIVLQIAVLLLMQAFFFYPAEQRIDAYDMAIILNNALENAIAACEKVDGTREICLHAYRKGSLFFIEICNDFSGGINIDSNTGLPVSTRQDTQYHGIGLSNILRCARK